MPFGNLPTHFRHLCLKVSSRYFDVTWYKITFDLEYCWVFFFFSAQFAGLLCEEEGNGADNVQYCGYCKYHFSKLVRIY